MFSFKFVRGYKLFSALSSCMLAYFLIGCGGSSKKYIAPKTLIDAFKSGDPVSCAGEVTIHQNIVKFKLVFIPHLENRIVAEVTKNLATNTPFEVTSKPSSFASTIQASFEFAAIAKKRTMADWNRLSARIPNQEHMTILAGIQKKKLVTSLFYPTGINNPNDMRSEHVINFQGKTNEAIVHELVKHLWNINF